MSVSYAVELKAVLVEAQDIARRLDEPVGTPHVLWAFMFCDCTAKLLLEEFNITEANALELVKGERSEEEGTLDRALRAAAALPERRQRFQLNTLHVLVGMIRARPCRAVSTLETYGLDVQALRTRAMKYLTDQLPARYQDALNAWDQRATARPGERAAWESPISDAEMDAVGRDTPTIGRAATAPQAPAAAPAGGYAAPAVPAYTGTSRGGRSDDPFALDRRAFPTLAEHARNLSSAAWAGRLDAIAGREAIIDRVLDVLGKRRANNPLLVGEPGVGKTALVYGLVERIVREPARWPGFGRKVFIELNLAELTSGAGLRSAAAETLRRIRDEVAAGRDGLVVFLDDAHLLSPPVELGDGAAELRRALGFGEFPCIGATTPAQLAKWEERDASIARRFQVIDVPEPDADEGARIMAAVGARFGDYHGVTYAPEALDAAWNLAARYLPERRFPDKAINLLDLAGSRARRAGRDRVERADTAEVVAGLAGVPADQMLETDQTRLLRLEERLAARIIGHREAVARIADCVRRNAAGFRHDRPIGSFLFLGPTGVGKTETARALADLLFGGADAMLRVDMSEYMEPHSVSRLIGSPPGYVGWDEGGYLTDGVRTRPYRLVLFDEIEKAHPDVLRLLLQILEDGRLTDSHKRTARFDETVVILTSNIGAVEFTSKKAAVGFGGGDDASRTRVVAERVRDEAKRVLAPELWNRIDEKLVFAPLDRAESARVAELLLKRSAARLFRERAVSFTWTPGVVDVLLDAGGYDPAYGARPMRAVIHRLVEAPLAEWIVAGRLRRGEGAVVDVDGDALRVVPAGAADPAAEAP